jgi:hypothetical protein
VTAHPDDVDFGAGGTVMALVKAGVTVTFCICTDGDAWTDGLKLYHELNGGRLYNKIKIIKLPNDKDVCDLRGQIEEYYYEIK